MGHVAVTQRSGRRRLLSRARSHISERSRREGTTKTGSLNQVARKNQKSRKRRTSARKERLAREGDHSPPLHGPFYSQGRASENSLRWTKRHRYPRFQRSQGSGAYASNGHPEGQRCLFTNDDSSIQTKYKNKNKKCKLFSLYTVALRIFSNCRNCKQSQANVRRVAIGTRRFARA